jgi:hypothetical protein
MAEIRRITDLCAPIWVKFSQFRKISANFGVCSAKIGGEVGVTQISYYNGPGA